MSQPLSHPDLRRQNLALLLETLLRREDATRKQIERESGLSKATVSRLVDELIHADALVAGSAEPTEPAARGRRAVSLRVPSALGAVMGLSLGVRTTSVFATDLAGHELAWRQFRTPKWADFDEAADWIVGVVSREMRALGVPLRRLGVAVPARPIDGVDITGAPLFMATIEGPALARTLADRLACPVRFDLDAAMVLAGLETLGFVDEDSRPVLLNLGSVLTMSMRRHDGAIAGGETPSFGDFSLIPFESALGPSTLGALLGAHGLFEASERLGRPLEAMEDLWETDTADVRRLRGAFHEAFRQIVRIIVVMADPTRIIVTGRLAPLAREGHGSLMAELEEDVTGPPALQVIGHAENDYPAALGAARESRAAAVRALLDRVAREGLDALR